MTYLENMPLERLKLSIVFLGCMIAIWVMYLQHGWINNDSVLYFEVARLFSLHEWQKGVTLYQWPFYPLLISLVHQLTSLTFYHSAQVLNLIFFAICCYSFSTLIQLCGGSHKTLIAGASLLLSSSYIIGDILPMLMRDEGFWAFSLTAYVSFIRYFLNRQLKDALIWQICILIAMLFRVEAISLLILLPFILLFDPHATHKKRIYDFFTVNILFIIASILLVLALYLLKIIDYSNFGRLQEVIQFAGGNFTRVLLLKSHQLGDLILGKYLASYSLMVLTLGLLSIVIVKSISAAGLLPSLLIAINYKAINKKLSHAPAKILRWAILINFINIVFIILNVYVLSGRYIVGFSLILLIFASFALDYFWNHSNRIFSNKTISKSLILAILLFNFINIIMPKSPGYNYEQDAVAWVQEHNINKLPVLYISPRARYYANSPYQSRGYDYWDYTHSLIQNKQYLQYNYLVVNLDNKYLLKENALIAKFPGYKKIHEIWGYKKKKKILILQKV